VPRHRRPNPIRARLRSLLVIVIGGGAVLATTVLSALGSSAGDFGADLSGWMTVLVVLAAVAVNAGIFLLAFRVSTAHPTSIRDLMPGAITAALIWQMLQLFGTAYVGSVVKDSGLAYGVFTLVLGLLGWIYLGAVGVVISAEINVVRAKHLYPRSLMTPFTDNVDLTAADRRAYTDSATAQKAKGFQNVAVTFDHDGQHASARRATAAAAEPSDELSDDGVEPTAE
jgi:membrane protein